MDIMEKQTKHVVAAVIIRGNRVLATQRGYGEYKDYWEFPGGKVEDGETEAQALAREIREELACDIRVGERIARISYEYPTFHLEMSCLRCALVPGEEPRFLEHEDARWLSARQLSEVAWLPADLSILPVLRDLLTGEAGADREGGGK